MLLPQPVPFSTLANGDVASIPGTGGYIIRNLPDTYTDLSNGAITAGVAPGTLVLPLPSAHLVL